VSRALAPWSKPAQPWYQRDVVTIHVQRRRHASIWMLCASQLRERPSLALLACLAALHALTPAPLRAYEDQATLGVDLGYAHATAGTLPHSGAMLGLEASLGLGDIWSVRAVASYSLHPGATSLSIVMLGAELLYLVDVLEVVPYFGAGVDALGSWFERSHGLAAELGAHPVVGLDWLVNRDMALGIAARPVFSITAWDRAPIYLTVSVSASLLLDL
jgi:hypothetical protein